MSEAVLHKREHAMITKGSGEVDKEKLEMRKRIMELEMENDILKKTELIFSRSGQGDLSRLTKREAGIGCG